MEAVSVFFCVENADTSVLCNLPVMRSSCFLLLLFLFVCLSINELHVRSSDFRFHFFTKKFCCSLPKLSLLFSLLVCYCFVFFSLGQQFVYLFKIVPFNLFPSPFFSHFPSPSPSTFSIFFVQFPFLSSHRDLLHHLCALTFNYV